MTKAAQTETLFPEDKPKPKAKVAELKRGVRGGYQPAGGGKKPKLPTTGSGVKRPPAREIVVHKPQPPRTLLQVCAEAARDKNVDVAKMKELLAMARLEQDRAAEAEFNEAMRACSADMPPIAKDSWNQHTKSKWAKLEKISKAVDPIIHKHGFTLSYGMGTSPLNDHYRIICDVSHKGGHTRRYEADIGTDSKGPKGEGTKSLAQGSGSSISYGRRYLKCMIFDINIVGEDNDGQGASSEQITAKQAEALNDRIDEVGMNKAKFCAAFNIDGVAMLPANRLKEANDRLDQYAVNKGKL